MASELEKAAYKALQAELISLGYLPKGGDDGNFGKGSTRALKRFQRHAGRQYRVHAVSGLPADVVPTLAFKGTADGKADDATRAEIKKWLKNKWKLPLGRFAFKKVGASSFSFHIVGRTIDLQQALANPKGRRYYIMRDASSGARDFWRLYCKTINQDGTQGTLYEKGALSCQSSNLSSSFDIPKGYYIDLTAEIERNSVFERIPAHDGWDTNYNKTEWWHFQYALDKQATFQDECELVGISEADLKKAGYTVDDMDRKPG